MSLTTAGGIHKRNCPVTLSIRYIRSLSGVEGDRSSDRSGRRCACSSSLGSKYGSLWRSQLLPFSSSWCWSPGRVSVIPLSTKSIHSSLDILQARQSWRSWDRQPPSSSLLVCLRSSNQLFHQPSIFSRASQQILRHAGPSILSSSRNLVLGLEYTLVLELQRY